MGANDIVGGRVRYKQAGGKEPKCDPDPEVSDVR